MDGDLASEYEILVETWPNGRLPEYPESIDPGRLNPVACNPFQAFAYIHLSHEMYGYNVTKSK